MRYQQSRGILEETKSPLRRVGPRLTLITARKSPHFLAGIFVGVITHCAVKMRVVHVLKNGNFDSDRSLFKEPLDEGNKTWNEMPLVTLEREDHLTASRPQMDISEKRATFCNVSCQL